jgi:hypothetical protein
MAWRLYYKVLKIKEKFMKKIIRLILVRKLLSKIAVFAYAHSLKGNSSSSLIAT